MTVYAKKEDKVIQKVDKAKDVKDNQAIEIIAALTFLSIMLTSEASKTLGLEKICISGYYGQHSCSFLRTQYPWSKFHDGLIYDNFTAHFMWWTAVQTVLSSVVLAFLGNWSDKTGRRKVILRLPVIGVFLQIMNGFINIIFFYELPFEFFFFFDAFYGSIVGYSIVFFGFFIYLYDVTTAEDRVYQLASILLCALAGVSLGSVLSRILLNYTCYYALYGLAFVINIVNRYRIIKKLEDPIRTDEQIMYDDQNLKEFLRTFFVCSAIKETARAVSKKEPNKRNVYMYVYLGTMFILFISLFGESSVFDLIARFDYSWDSAKVNVFNLYSIITTILGIWIAVAVIRKKYEYHDAVIGIMSCVSKIVSSFIFAFASPDDIFYLGPVFSMLNGAGLLAIVFMLTKLVEKNEIGKIASFVGIIECVARLLYVTLYYFMYTNMGHRTDVYLVGAGITVPALIVFIWILRKEKREEAMQTTTEDTALNI